MHKRSFVGIGTWIGIGGLLWVIAWIIAESIPGFIDLLSFVVCFACSHDGFTLLTCQKSALFGSIFSCMF